MRMLFKARMDTQAANQAFKSGTMQKMLESTIEGLHPEAAYFTAEEGHRTCMIVFDMQDSSQMPSIAEPFFREFGAEVDFEPVMNLQDLQTGLADATRH